MNVGSASSTYASSVYDSKDDDREYQIHFEVRNIALQRTSITIATRSELAQLEKTIRGHFKDDPKTRQLEHWLRYIVEVMSFCVRNELLDLD